MRAESRRGVQCGLRDRRVGSGHDDDVRVTPDVRTRDGRRVEQLRGAAHGGGVGRPARDRRHAPSPRAQRVGHRRARATGPDQPEHAAGALVHGDLFVPAPRWGAGLLRTSQQ